MHVELAFARQARVVRIADAAAQRAHLLWRKRMTAGFDAGWQSLEPDLVSITAAAQVAAAAGASAYLSRTAAADGVQGAGAGLVQPGALAGVDASGRDLAGLLFGAVTTAKTLVGGGAGVAGALSGGSAYLSTMVHTAVTDTARSADLTAMTARSYTYWIRVVSPGACSRCAILAGGGSAQRAFLRHPRCKCTAAPETKTSETPERFGSPADYFASLSRAEQDRTFTAAGAEAIRAGADPVAVVSARRGAKGIDYGHAILDGKTLPNSGRRLERTVIGHRPDGSPILGYTTGEGTTVRGDFAKRQRIAGAGTQKVGDSRYRTTKRVRLMPETIVDLTDDVDMRQVLLRDAGYLDFAFAPRHMTGSGWIDERAAMIRGDRAKADAFYREHGIEVGG